MTHDRWRLDAIATGMILVASGILLARLHDVGFVGFDAYPIIAAARVRSFADLLNAVTEELMDGLYPAGSFYRPVLNLTIAVDYALWGLEPLGYQFTNVLSYAAAAAAIYFCIRRILGPTRVVAPLVGLLFFLLHPVQIEVVPVSARRGELLCCLFMALSLGTQLAPSALMKRRPPILPALFTLLAVGSKETGVITPALIALGVLFYSPRSVGRSRLAHVALCLVPHTVAVLLIVGVRFSLLGGLGGHRPPDLMGGLWALPGFFVRTLQWVAFPYEFMRSSSWARVLPVSAATGLCLLGIRELLASRHRRGGTRSPRSVIGAGGIGVVWLALLAQFYAWNGFLRPWYTLLPAAATSLLLGILAEQLVATIRHATTAWRAISALTILALLSLFGWPARFSPLIYPYDGWTRGSVASAAFLQELDSMLEHASPGSKLMAPPVPRQVPKIRDGPHIQASSLLSHYSIQAWAELRHPELRVRVRQWDGGRQLRAAPDEVLVVLTKRLTDF